MSITYFASGYAARPPSMPVPSASATHVGMIFLLNLYITLDEASKERVRKNALAAVDIYSLEHFYENIMEVYTRVCRQNW